MIFKNYILGIIFLLSTQLVTSQIEGLNGEVLIKAEEMPLWQGCDVEGNPTICSEEQFKIYLDKHLKYPKKAITQQKEGTVIIGCIINKKGKILQPSIITDIGAGCGEEALRLVKNMPLWIPAAEKGEPVNIIYNLKVPFIFSKNEKPITKLEPQKPIVPNKNISDNTPTDSKDTLKEEYDLNQYFTDKREMPFFAGCTEFNDDHKKKRNCSNQKLIEFVSSNLIYPEEAKNQEIEGIVYVSFNVNEKGELYKPQIKRNIGGGCGKEALRVISLMPNWEPGSMNGKAVDVVMTLPVRFSLSTGNNSRYKIHWGNLKKEVITPEQVERVLKEEIIVRNRFGDNITISSLNLSYERRTKFKEENSIGKVTLAMMRMLKKVKAGGIITINATIQEKGEMIDIQRVFEIIK